MIDLQEDSGMARRSGLSAIAIAAGVCILLGLSRPAAAAELIIFEEDGCLWCAAWQREIGESYHRTDEGRRAPLRRVDKFAERPADLTGIEGIHFTPTFVLVQNGAEVGRIVGYPGEHFFYPMLQKLLVRLDSGSESQATH